MYQCLIHSIWFNYDREILSRCRHFRLYRYRNEHLDVQWLKRLVWSFMILEACCTRIAVIVLFLNCLHKLGISKWTFVAILVRILPKLFVPIKPSNIIEIWRSNKSRLVVSRRLWLHGRSSTTIPKPIIAAIFFSHTSFCFVCSFCYHGVRLMTPFGLIWWDFVSSFLKYYSVVKRCLSSILVWADEFGKWSNLPPKRIPPRSFNY